MPDRQILFSDVDDILHPFQHPRYAFHVERVTGYTYPYEQHRAYACDALPITKEQELEAVYATYDDPLFWEQDPMAGSVDAITILAEHFRVIPITSRPIHIQAQSDQWLGDHFGGKLDPAIFVGLLGTSEYKVTKLDHAKKMGVVAICDDRRDHLLGCSAAGIQGFLFHRPWNKEEPDHEDFVRTNDWDLVLATLVPTKVN